MKNKAIILPIIAAAMLFVVAASASACSCIYLENTEARLNNAAYVFTGEVTDIKISDSYANQETQEVTARIIDTYKPSQFPEPVSLKIYATKDTGANCGYDFKKGEKYLIYAYLNAETNRFETNSCMGNSVLSKAENEIKELNALTNKTQTNQNNNSNNNQNPNQNQEETDIFIKFINWLRNLFS